MAEIVPYQGTIIELNRDENARISSEGRVGFHQCSTAMAIPVAVSQAPLKLLRLLNSTWYSIHTNAPKKKHKAQSTICKVRPVCQHRSATSVVGTKSYLD